MRKAPLNEALFFINIETNIVLERKRNMLVK